MARYGMVIDLNRCVRCRTCYVACKREHKILAHPRDEKHPHEYYRLRYVEWEWGRYPMIKRSFIPFHCVQCDEPICIAFCPTEAITLGKHRIIRIDRERCNGCGVCAAVCPYGALSIDHENKADGCDFCADRLDAGSMPVCVEMCPAGARAFGDLDDSNSTVSKILKSGRAKSLVLKGAKHSRVFYVPSPNEAGWNELEGNSDFEKAFNRRKRDLPPVKGVL